VSPDRPVFSIQASADEVVADGDIYQQIDLIQPAGCCGLCVCLLLQDLLQSGSRGGEEESGRHVL
jgi:hypothetical protein